jgi:hypothetical protein
LVKGRLGAKAAILRAGAGFGINDGTEVNLVSLEVFADAVGPGEQIKDVRCPFQFKEPPGLVTSNVSAVHDALAKFAQALVNSQVK